MDKKSLILVAAMIFSTPVHATFINNATGLASPDVTVTFDGSGLAQNTLISNQFSGVSFTPSLRLQPSTQCSGCTGFANDFVANFFPTSSPIDFTMIFDNAVDEAMFAMTDQGDTWTFEALLGASLVESASLTIPSAPGVGFVGFSDIQFDRIRVFTATTSAMGIDNIQYNNNVPEPTTLALMGLGLAGIGFKRRKAA